MLNECLFCKKAIPDKQKYCSKECYYKSRRGVRISKKTEFTSSRMAGKKNPRWNGGKYVNARYISLLLPEHPYSNNRGYYKEHRYVAELSIKRYLTKNEIIHHIDGNRHNNKLENEAYRPLSLTKFHQNRFF
jgi:hypothetical protein